MKMKLLGPPGCGKTTALLEYLEKELEAGVLPHRVAFLTFTRAARYEALQRTQKTNEEFPYLKTIHSICYHQLGTGRDQIVRPEDIRVFGKKIGIKLTGNELDPWIEEFERGNDAPTRDDMLLQVNHQGRHRKIMLKEALQETPLDIDWHYASWFTNAYRNWKVSEGMLDYTDLLTDYVEFGEPLDIDVLFVDEAQDLSKLQWDVVNILGAKAQRWYTAGDDDQAIFDWAGADSSVFQAFQADQTRVLNQSYRVSRAVHGMAQNVVKRIEHRLTKDYDPTKSDGYVGQAGYLGSIDLSQRTFILFRNHYRGAILSEVLKKEGVPYTGKGSPLTNLDARAALLAWAKLIKEGEAKTEEIKRMLKYCDTDYLNFNIEKKLKENGGLKAEQVFMRVPYLKQWYTVLKDIPHRDILASYVDNWGFKAVASPNLELMSIHQSKGREAHTVVIDPEISRAVWLGMIKNPDSEHRVHYVAVTRAKERVFILFPDGNYSYVYF